MNAEKKRLGLIFRHPGVVRATHWVNVLCLTILFMSGLNIFNAHPSLYFGSKSTFDHPAFSIDSKEAPGGPVGVTTIGGRAFTTTGVLGVSGDRTDPDERAFPRWITIPADYDLATARRWHFLFAWLFVINGAMYLLYGFGSGHVRRDLVPRRSDLGKIGSTIRDHLRLRFAHDEDPGRYNVLQMMTYFIVACVLLPLIVLAGWSMSPGIDTFAPFLPELFGGRQSARTAHFLIAWLLVLFTVVHIAMVLVSGVLNNLRSMITGWYRVN